MVMVRKLDIAINRRKKTSSFFLLHSDGHKTNFNSLFWMLTPEHICWSFAFVLVSISLIQGWRVKVNK